jgi:hypothetical protein
VPPEKTSSRLIHCTIASTANFVSCSCRSQCNVRCPHYATPRMTSHRRKTRPLRCSPGASRPDPSRCHQIRPQMGRIQLECHRCRRCQTAVTTFIIPRFNSRPFLSLWPFLPPKPPGEIQTYGYVKPLDQWFSIKGTPRPTPSGSPGGSRAIPIGYSCTHPPTRKPTRAWARRSPRLGLRGSPEPQAPDE